MSSSDLYAGFAQRHLGATTTEDLQAMLRTVGVSSLDQLIEETIPDDIRLARPEG